MPTTDAKFTKPNRPAIPRKQTKVRRSEKQWMAIFEARRKSGLSVERFCSANNIGPSAYWKWSKLLGSDKNAATTKVIEPTFIPIPIRVAPSSSLELELGAMRLRFDGPATERVIDAIIKRIATHA